MPGAPTAQQLINGVAFDYSSIEARIDGTPYAGFKSISYDHGLEPGEGRGTRAQVALRSRGKYTAGGSIEVYKYDYQKLITALGAVGARGFMEYAFNILVSYREFGFPIITDKLMYCRLKKASESPSEDGGVLTVKCDLSLMYVVPGSLGANTPLLAVEPTKFIK